MQSFHYWSVTQVTTWRDALTISALIDPKRLDRYATDLANGPTISDGNGDSMMSLARICWLVADVWKTNGSLKTASSLRGRNCSVTNAAFSS
ncbi:hypothetical protein CY34DRAFT_200479 [Suillus luteus UH-Slu-Lm8-n1]|uniref:Uncharacterized protein n=1 Tax=Suillus luteus UH-Slu-Lm8-n1 TaxID=930992 RepID=A0A0D0AUE9_9AGAM|nr:hypothetical protein CY34DRAFT_200479 [Suillus luteus UH-Slu-Lm8-n1]